MYVLTDIAPRSTHQRTLLSALQPAAHKLIHLRIVIGTTVHINQSAYSEPSAPPEEYAHAFRPSTFDFAGTATALARALPSLRHVFLTTGGFLAHVDPYSTQGRSRSGEPYERWCVSRGWRIDPNANANGRPGGPGADDRNAGGVQDLAVEGEPRLVELHAEVADTIIRTEELVLSERDEVSGIQHNGVPSLDVKLTVVAIISGRRWRSI